MGNTRISTRAVRAVIAELDGALTTPENVEQLAFFKRSIAQAADEYKLVQEGDRLRHLAPSFGMGTPLDLMTPQEMSELVAGCAAHTFEGELPETTRPSAAQGDDTPPFQIATRELLMGVYEDVWSVVEEFLQDGTLEVVDALNGDKIIALSDSIG